MASPNCSSSPGDETGLREFTIMRGTKSVVQIAGARTGDVPLTLSGWGRALGTMDGQNVRIKGTVRLTLDQALTRQANDAGEDHEGARIRVGEFLQAKGYTEIPQN